TNALGCAKLRMRTPSIFLAHGLPAHVLVQMTIAPRVLLLALAVAACSCKTKQQQYHENHERKVALATPVVESFRDQLRGIRDDLERTLPREETPCDADAVGRAFGSADASMGPLFVDTVLIDDILAKRPSRELRDNAFFVKGGFAFAPSSDPVTFAEA